MSELIHVRKTKYPDNVKRWGDNKISNMMLSDEHYRNYSINLINSKDLIN